MKNSLRKLRYAAVASACLTLLLFAAQNQVSAQTKSQTANRQLEAWKIFSPTGKNFRVSLPAEPAESDSDDTQKFVSGFNSEINQTGGELPFLGNTTVYNLETRWNEFRIVVLDHKWQKIEYDGKTGILTLSSENSEDEVLTREWLKFKNAKMLPGGVFVSDANFVVNVKNVRARAVATKNKVYLLLVTSPDLRGAPADLAQVFQAEADKFFNSFQILDNKPQIARNKGKN